eukprot:gb/GEZN01005682.1/.p1 GENE.gb/GEZN01005682.1/~~gb/GEZN01005682.1/.p1  ORF type:complete len:498 (-),score=20.47 gb/GEZN01005682.1/:275-1666(-)
MAAPQQCVTEGYCDTDSYNLWGPSALTSSSRQPCGTDSVLSRSKCYVCDNGVIDDKEKLTNRKCIRDLCTPTKAAKGEKCCGDWWNTRSPSSCIDSLAGVYCQPQYYCDFNSTLEEGVCKDEPGPQPYLRLGDECKLWSPATLLEPGEHPVCDRTGCLSSDIRNNLGCYMQCNVGQPVDNDYNNNFAALGAFYDSDVGTCKALNRTATNPVRATAYIGTEWCVHGLQCPYGQKCDYAPPVQVPGKCVVAAFANTTSQLCKSDTECGHGKVCLWKNKNETTLPGECSFPYTRKYGEQCGGTTLCGAGLYCNGMGFCDRPEAFCGCLTESTVCGRAKICSCPTPAFVTTKIKPSCRDATIITDEESDRYHYTISLKAMYQCYATQQISPYSGSPEQYKLAKEKCMTQKNAVLQSYRGDDFDQPACGTSPGSQTFGANLMGSNGVSRAAPMIVAFLPALAVLLQFT